MTTVSRRRERGAWQVRYRDLVGRQRSREFVRTVEAKRFRAEVETDIDRGTWIDPSGADQPSKAWALHWLAIRQWPSDADAHREAQRVLANLDVEGRIRARRSRDLQLLEQHRAMSYLTAFAAPVTGSSS